MSLVGGLFWSILIVGGIPLLAVAGALLVRRWVTVEVLERHNDVAGFIYAVIGVLYAVLLGFTAIIVWERFDQAQANVEREANELGDLFRQAKSEYMFIAFIGAGAPSGVFYGRDKFKAAAQPVEIVGRDPFLVACALRHLNGRCVVTGARLLLAIHLRPSRMSDTLSL